MFGVTEDDESFNPSASSNLASLFGTAMTIQANNETDLSYTAPKQPKSQEKNNKSQSVVLCSKFVEAFKLVENEHVNQGKCGIAIIGNEALNILEVIIYKSKQDIITRSKLKMGFIFHRQSNQFVSFCDDQQQQWSIHFENFKEMEDFLKEIQLHGGQIIREITPTPPIKIKQDKDSDSFSDTFTNKAKANILSRMAKMGQSILPKTNVSPSLSDNSDSDEKTTVKKTKKVRPSKEKVITDQSVNLPISQPEFVFLNGKPVPISALQQNFNLPTLNQSIWSHPQPISDPLNIFIAENRTHNCEIRMNISQLSSKLDKIFEEVTKSKVTFPTAYEPRDAIVALNKNEENKILQNNLKTAHEVINHLTEENEGYRRNMSKQEEKINNLQQEIVKYRELQEQSEKQCVTITELEELASNQKQSLEMLTKFHEEHKNCDSKITEMLTEQNNKLRLKLSNKVVQQDLFSKKLKQAMNSLYQTLMETFSNENVTFQASEIKEILSNNLKTTTFNVIEEFNNDFKDEEEVKSV